jgi:hypothetical protein
MIQWWFRYRVCPCWVTVHFHLHRQGQSDSKQQHFSFATPTRPSSLFTPNQRLSFFVAHSPLVSLDSNSASSFLHRRRVPHIASLRLSFFLSSSPPHIFLVSFSTTLQRPSLTRILAAGILACRFSTYLSQPPLYTSRALLFIVESLCFAVHQSSRLQRNSPLKSRPAKRESPLQREKSPFASV